MTKSTRKTGRDGLLKDGTSRMAKAGTRRGMPRIMWLAIVVCVVGAVLLFRNQGGNVPTGIGERRSVVTVGADSAVVPDGAPRSGDVDISGEVRALTPEQPHGGTAATEQPAQSKPEPAAAKPATTKPAAKPVAADPQPAPDVERIIPLGDGGWLVQVGSFGEAANADGAAAKLQAKGWDARVKVGNTSNGTMIHRVQIGYFASRETAAAFIAQNRLDLDGAIAVHR